MEASNDGLFDWNLVTNEIYYSPGWKKMLGYEDHELPNDFSVWENTTDPEDVKKSWELQQMLIKKQIDRFVMEFKMKHKNGHWVDILSRAEAFFDANGRAVRMVGTHTDITVLKQAEQELIKAKEKAEESEERLLEAQKASKVGSWETDLSNFKVIWSEETYRIFEINSNTFQASHEAFLNFVHPDDKKNVDDAFVKSLSTKDYNSIEHRIITSKDTIKYVIERWKIVFNEQGNPARAIGTCQDITESKKAEQELIKAKERAEESERQLNYSQKVARIGYYVFNIQTGLWSSSEMLDEIFGINKDYVRDVQGWLSLIHPDFQKIMLDYLSVNILSNYENFDKSYQIINKRNNISYWVHGLGSLEFDENGNILKMFGTIQDISISKEFEKELIYAKLKAEENDRLKSAFLANMSHEIRTPMNGILGFATLLKEPGLSSKEHQEYIGVIEKSGKRMLNIINDIIDISKIEAGLMEFYINEFNINEQIDYTYTFFKPEAEAKGINLSFKITLPQKDAIIKSDIEKVYAILTNLVKNAIKYTEKGSIEFGYNLKNKIGHSQLEFFVKDSGIGIQKDRQEAIFERFIQADISDKKARQGAGLGLSISKAYVEMLGGKIWVESEEGKGSTFYFTLPYNTEAPTETIEQPFAVSDNSDDFMKLKILIAEDDSVSTRLIEKYVEIFGKEPIKVCTGFEAVETCRNNPDIDLILMDIQMPEMNGYEATKQIREFNNEVIIIAQTAYGLSGDREKSIEAGCNDYIKKPIDKAELLSLIQKHFTNC